MAVHVVCGVKLDGTRDILAVEPMYEESEASYTTLFDKLKARGVEHVWLVVSDAHKALLAQRESHFWDHPATLQGTFHEKYHGTCTIQTEKSLRFKAEANLAST